MLVFVVFSRSPGYYICTRTDQPWLTIASNCEKQMRLSECFTKGTGIIDSMGSNHSKENIVASRIIITRVN